LECKLKKMNIDLKSIIVLLATQAMINLGEIKDPINHEVKHNLDGAAVFIQLLEVLETKTRGNLTPEEENYLMEVRENLEKVYQKKINAGN
jgi:hypothetical protein